MAVVPGPPAPGPAGGLQPPAAPRGGELRRPINGQNVRPGKLLELIGTGLFGQYLFGAPNKTLDFIWGGVLN